MSAVLTLYKAWLFSPDVTESQVNRIGVKVLKDEQILFLEEVLAHPKCPDAFADLVKKSANPSSRHAWLGSRHCTKEEYAWYVSYYSPEKLLEADGLHYDANKSRAQELWKKNDPVLRLKVLVWLQWHGEKFPIDWGKWYFKALREEAYGEPLEVLKELTEEQGVTLPSFWSAAVQTGDLRNICLVHQVIPPRGLTIADSTMVLRKIKENFEGPGSEKLSLEEMLPSIKKVVTSGTFSDGGELYALSTQVVSLLDEDDPNYLKLNELLVSLKIDKEVVPTEEDLIALMEDGELPDAAIEKAGELYPECNTDSFWGMVASHPKLAIDRVPEILYQAEDNSIDAALEVIIKGRSADWVEEAAVHMWKSGNINAGANFLKLLPAETLKKVIKDLLEEKVFNVRRLIEHDVLPEYSLKSIPVSKVVKLGEDVVKKLVLLSCEELKDDDVAWEIFETLLESSEEATYGEILLTSKMLAEDTQK